MHQMIDVFLALVATNCCCVGIEELRTSFSPLSLFLTLPMIVPLGISILFSRDFPKHRRIAFVAIFLVISLMLLSGSGYSELRVGGVDLIVDDRTTFAGWQYYASRFLALAVMIAAVQWTVSRIFKHWIGWT